MYSDSPLFLLPLSNSFPLFTNMGVIDFSVLNELEAKVAVFNYIRAEKYAEYQGEVERFQRNWRTIYEKQPGHKIFKLKIDDMKVSKFEITLFFMENTVILQKHTVTWETKFFDALQINSDDRISDTLRKHEVQIVEDDKDVVSSEDENRIVNPIYIEKENFVQQFVNEFNKTPKHVFNMIERDNGSQKI